MWECSATKGQQGLQALVSLLLALESEHYVLTTGSNWSQLINELRMAIVDSRCGQCTTVVDLRSQDEMCQPYRTTEQPRIDKQKKPRSPGARPVPNTLQRFYNQMSLCYVWP